MLHKMRSGFVTSMPRMGGGEDIIEMQDKLSALITTLDATIVL